MRHASRWCGLLLALPVAIACGENGGAQRVAAGDGGPGGRFPVRPPDGREKAAVHAEEESEARTEAYDGPVERIAASNILVSYAGAQKASAEVVRTRDEAKALADELYGELRGGASFEELADARSDGPERGHGGLIGVFTTNRMLPQISRAALSVAEGEIAGPVESPYGFHIVRREKIEEVYLAQILVAFKGAEGAPDDMERSEEGAAARAAEAMAEAMKPGAQFGPVAGTFSDHPSKMVGGVMGPAFKGLLPPDLERLAFSLRENEIGGPVRTEEGFVILKRLEEIHLRHILVAHKDAARMSSKITRTLEEAGALAQEAYGKLGRGEDFSSLALRYSDCPSRAKGGDLGITARGMMTPKFEEAAFALDVGETSGVVKTEFGFHIIERLPR